MICTTHSCGLGHKYMYRAGSTAGLSLLLFSRLLLVTHCCPILVCPYLHILLYLAVKFLASSASTVACLFSGISAAFSSISTILEAVYSLYHYSLSLNYPAPEGKHQNSARHRAVHNNTTGIILVYPIHVSGQRKGLILCTISICGERQLLNHLRPTRTFQTTAP